MIPSLAIKVNPSDLWEAKTVFQQCTASRCATKAKEEVTQKRAGTYTFC